MPITTFDLKMPLRLHGIALIDTALKDAACLLDRLHDHWCRSLISAVECYQIGPEHLRSKKQVEKLLAILQGHGWITLLSDGAIVRGKKPREVWQIYGKEAR